MDMWELIDGIDGIDGIEGRKIKKALLLSIVDMMANDEDAPERIRVGSRITLMANELCDMISDTFTCIAGSSDEHNEDRKLALEYLTMVKAGIESFLNSIGYPEKFADEVKIINELKNDM